MRFNVWCKEITDRPGIELFKGSIEVEMTDGPNGMLLNVLKREPPELEIIAGDVLELTN